MREWALGHYRRLRGWVQGDAAHERLRELVGAGLAQQVAQRRQIISLQDVEFRVHSQFGDDGIVQWLVGRLPNIPRLFIEFGVEDYTEANTRFLMVNNQWSGLVMDGSEANIKRLRARPWFWRHDLTALAHFVTRENVDGLISNWAMGRDVGLLHIDVDGNDYWLWEAVQSISPAIVIMEYNALFGAERTITVPYRADFQRMRAHYSGQYFGASLPALAYLANRKGYALIGTNSAGNNAYFLRRELLQDTLQELSVAQAWTPPYFRDSRDKQGHLDLLSYEARKATLRGLFVVDVRKGTTESF
jgi:hypothetical protein